MEFQIIGTEFQIIGIIKKKTKFLKTHSLGIHLCLIMKKPEPKNPMQVHILFLLELYLKIFSIPEDQLFMFSKQIFSYIFL
jgi:hypothetical protein